jgi:ferredoxin-thioredoxin reductase catalytic subunit
MTVRKVDDLDYVSAMLTAIKNNGGYCPCQLQKTPDTKCMCKEFREQEKGHCHCGLYVKF